MWVGGIPSDYLVSTQLQLLLFCCWGCGCCWAVTIETFYYFYLFCWILRGEGGRAVGGGSRNLVLGNWIENLYQYFMSQHIYSLC